MNNVLVVEDEANILKLVAVNLISRGYQVSEAKNGAEALRQLRISQPSLMVLDIKLSDFTGWDLLKRIKSEPLIVPTFPVLIMTASISETSFDLDTYPNVVEILTKPFSVTRLVRAVEQSISHR
jgi:two-component system response regulator GlrR